MNFNPLAKLISLIFGTVISFLTWFILLVSFFGDVTIWIFRSISHSIELAFEKVHIDLSKKAQIFVRIGHHPLIYKDRSFKVGILTIALLVFGVWFLTRDLPSPKQLETRQIPQTTRIFDRNGKILFNVYEDQNRTIVSLSAVPENLKKATIATEDKDFYKHRGFDVYGIIRAARATLFQGNVQGGSTITQQLVKSVFLSPERTVSRKIKELYLAFRVETAFSKDKILEMYLNQVPYGGTAWGVSAAAQQYFGKDLKDLDLAESALLAGLPAAPTYYSPFGQNPKRALERQKFVLARMYEEHYITKADEEKAAGEELKFRRSAVDIKAPHFVMYVRDWLSQKYGDAVATHGGLKVTTTLDLGIEASAEAAVAKNIEAVKYLDVSNGAALVTRPATGEILAMVGSKDFFDEKIDGNVNVTIASRQPGSSIKPINYATALSKKLITPATVIMDVSTTFGVAGTKPYTPVNYDGQYHGPVQVRFALANSYNIPAVKVLAISGVEDMIKMAREMGITTFTDPSRYGLSLTLGGGEVKMTEMATAFGVFANDGVRQDLTPILKVEDSNGRVLEEFKPKAGKRVLSREVSFLISSILSDNGARSAAFGPFSGLTIPGKTVAVKTGTTDDKRDNWTIGYTPSFLVVTWVGNNDNHPMSQYLASGITGAAPIWNDIMKSVLKDKVNEALRVPSGVVGAQICTFTGGPVTGGCPSRFEYFLTGTQPTTTTAVRAKVWVDKVTNKIVAAGAPNAEEREEFVIVDPYSKQNFCGSCAPPPSPSPSPSPSPGH
ncbi:MAG: transglycosylase domain-containing protein [Candidatus Curtissbacteria bacterium]|nr:transglycosylase domain-containing protein [Candidatus Curtissbacteria bacterium]